MSRATQIPTMQATQIIGNRHQATSSPMVAVRYHGGRNFKSARLCLPQKPSTEQHRKKKRYPRSPEDRHRGKHRRLPDEATARSTFRNTDQPAPTIHCDSQSVIHLIYNPIYHAKTKHIKVRYHHIRELMTEKKLEVQKIDTEVNITDCLTKPLLDQRFGALRAKMGLR